MKRTLLALVTCVLSVPPALAASYGDVMTPIRQFIDGFNAGDTASAYAAYAPGDILIIDEFAPHRWVGPHAAQDWAAGYDKHAQATGVSGGFVKYGEPTRAEIDGDTAYVIVPTVYLYKEHGKPIVEEGQMTFVLHGEPAGWKISAWTWSGVKPHPASWRRRLGQVLEAGKASTLRVQIQRPATRLRRPFGVRASFRCQAPQTRQSPRNPLKTNPKLFFPNLAEYFPTSAHNQSMIVPPVSSPESAVCAPSLRGAAATEAGLPELLKKDEFDIKSNRMKNLGPMPSRNSFAVTNLPTSSLLFFFAYPRGDISADNSFGIDRPLS